MILLVVLSSGAARVLKAEREGFKPPKRTSRFPDFESGPFGHSGISPEGEAYQASRLQSAKVATIIRMSNRLVSSFRADALWYKLSKLIAISPDFQISRGIYLIFSRGNGEILRTYQMILPKFHLIPPKFHLIPPKNFFFPPEEIGISSGAIWEIPREKFKSSER